MTIAEIMQLLADAERAGEWGGKRPDPMSVQIDAGTTGIELVLSAMRNSPDYGNECYWAVQLVKDYADEADALRWGREALASSWMACRGVFEVKTFGTANGWQAWCFFND